MSPEDMKFAKAKVTETGQRARVAMRTWNVLRLWRSRRRFSLDGENAGIWFAGDL